MPRTCAHACSPTARRRPRAELLFVSRARVVREESHFDCLERGLELVGSAIIGEDDLQCLLCLIDIAG
jgi:hypothetical protein